MLLDGFMVAALLDLDLSLFVQLTIFLLTVVGLNVLVFKPLFKVIDLRRERTDGLRERAVARVAEGEDARANHEQLYAEIVGEGDLARKATRETAQAREQRLLGDAKQDASALREQQAVALEKERGAAREAMNREIETLSGVIAERVTR
jgi:F-type H+-transporting ATPase subunit b